MRKFTGFVAVFVLGFAACALILLKVGALVPPAPFGAWGGASARGRENLARALDAAPVAAPPSSAAVATRNSAAVADAAAKVEPAVVNIDISGQTRASAEPGPFGFMRPGGVQQFAGSGSGIIISGDGYILTNNHVIAPVADGGSGSIVVRLDNGREFKSVTVVGRDPQTDLAVLKVAGAKDLPAAQLGDSDKLRVGDWAIAVGNPLGFNSTVTLGIVSALNRRGFRTENEALDTVIQTDAAINPGNSGGALADINGQVVGINTAIASSTGASVGIGFAIPINSAKRIIKQLVEKGKVIRPYLGIRYAAFSNIDRAAMKKLYPGLQLPEANDGVVVVNEDSPAPAVIPGSPADKAGLRPYDVILEVDGREIENIETVKTAVQKREVGDKLALQIWRNGKTFTATVTLETMPANYGATPQPAAPGGGGDNSPFGDNEAPSDGFVLPRSR